MRPEEIDALRFDIAFQIGRVSKTDLNNLKGHDRSKSDRAKYKIADGIIERLRGVYEITKHDRTAPSHSTTLRPQKERPQNE